MNGEQKQWRKLLRRECGGVLLEYVILLFFIITPLVLGSQALFNPSGDYAGNFGFVGTSFQQWYQRLISGISLPIP